jgi:DNA polymerase III epsilon subunit-like protein
MGVKIFFRCKFLVFFKKKSNHLFKLPLGQGKKKKKTMGSACKLVVVDCEMTGLDIYRDRLVQIAAVCGPKYFSTYVESTVPMKPEASAVTGITDDMLVGKPCIATALRMFSDWLKQLECEVILVAHCGMASDFPFIWVEMERCGFDPADMMVNVCGLFDTLIWARKWIRRDFLSGRTGSSSCGLVNLYHAMAGSLPTTSHDALADCLTLSTVMQLTGVQVRKPQAIKHLKCFTAQRKKHTAIGRSLEASATRATLLPSVQIIQAQ